jgi:hypothetical protein
VDKKLEQWTKSAAMVPIIMTPSQSKPAFAMRVNWNVGPGAALTKWILNVREFRR